MSTHMFIGTVAVLCCFTPAVSAQELPQHFRTIERTLDSGPLDGHGDPSTTIFETLVEEPGARWMMLSFDAAELGDEGTLQLESVADGQVQTFDGSMLATWGLHSGAFHGDAVLLRLRGGEREHGLRIRLKGLSAGVASGVDGGAGPADSADPCLDYEWGICDGVDDRQPSADHRVGMTFPAHATAWRAANGATLTAGHAFTPGGDPLFTLVQFHVGGSTEPGPIEHQYPVVAVAGFMNAVLGKDWAVFSLGPNSETQLIPSQVDGEGFRITLKQPSHDASVRVTGFGLPWCGATTTDTFQQTASGQYDDEDEVGPGAYIHDFSVDVTPGNQGSPLIWTQWGMALGIVTNSDCWDDDPFVDNGNSATSFLVKELRDTVGLFGGDTIYLDPAYPPIPFNVPDGSIFSPFLGDDELAIDDELVSHDKIALLSQPSSQVVAAILALPTPITLVAPNGPITFGD